MFEESEHIRPCKTHKTNKSFPMFEESENIRLVRLTRLMFWKRVST